MSTFRPIWSLTLLLTVACVPAWALELKLSVQEPTGIARVGEPVSGGIPLPATQFRKDQPFALFDGSREVALQATPLVVDGDGFVRWVLLDFQTDLKPNEARQFTLKDVKPKVAPPNPLMLKETVDSVVIDTGKATLTISKSQKFGLLDAVTVGSRAVVARGGSASYTDGFDGKRHEADVPTSVVVDYNGPMRATVSVKGRFVGDDPSKLLYVARITAWAGRSDVHVKYTLANSNPDHYAYRAIKDSTVTLRLAGQAAGSLLGAGRPIDAPPAAWMQQSSRVVPAVVHSSDVLGNCPWLRDTPGANGPGGAKAAADGKDVWTSQGKGDVAEGWVAARLGGSTVSAFDRYFVEDPPRRLAVNVNTIVLTGVTEPLEGAKPPFGDTKRWLFDCSHLSSQYVLDFAAPSDAAALSANAKRARASLQVVAPPAWYFQTEALPVGKFGDQADEMVAYDQWGWQYDKSQAPTRPTDQMARINRWVAADDNHFTSEQDTLDGLLLMYLRTGQRSFFDATEAWANYFMDLQTWRTDGWLWKDGGVWWHGGPAGNSPQRAADPVTGARNSLPAEWTKEWKTNVATFDRATTVYVNALFLAKACHCHNWGEGLAEYFLITGDRDAYEAAIDTAEQNYDTQIRAFRKAPGKPAGYSRDFTRACYLINATRLIDPTNPLLIKASDELARVYLERLNPEPRGFLNGPSKVDLKAIEQKTGPNGLARMKELGVTVENGYLVDPKTGAKWMPVIDPHTWMFPPLSRAMEIYCRLTGNEDAADWLIAYAQAASRVLYQTKHGNLAYGDFMVDFPVKGFAWDRHSWDLPAGSTDGAGVKINGYLAQFHPDVCARGYELTGIPLLKQRAYDFWNYGSHRGYNTMQLSNMGKVASWVNVYTTHGETVSFTGKTFYIWSHDRKDAKAPAPVADLKVAISGETATVSFTAPADEGGKVARYQVKCSDKPVADYEAFLRAWTDNQDAEVCNWWLAGNLAGEPAPAAAGKTESFKLTGVPAGVKYFAVVSYDDSSNRSALSNVAIAK